MPAAFFRHSSPALMLALTAGQAAAQPPRLESGMWHCTFTEQIHCGPGQPCVPIELNVRTLLDPATNRYIRCWNGLTDCLSQVGQFSTWGEQLTMQVPGSGTVVKISSDLRVTEISSIGPDVFIERGRCALGPASAGPITALPPR